jgi:hypothetical protein
MESRAGLRRLQAVRRRPGVRGRQALAPGTVQRAGTGLGPDEDGGSGASDDLGQAHLTQAWLAVSDDPAATVSGAYFYHKARRTPHPAVTSTDVQVA